MSIKPPFVIIADVEDKSGLKYIVLDGADVKIHDDETITVKGKNGSHVSSLNSATTFVEAMQKSVAAKES